ncbi:transglycosylase family protein [Rhodococcus sp. D2-41]|uniref:transglycosylase family protein n=1 Tax=Speluncibacter jeojiensis TaxID=2710754 RepID=UPI00240EA23C|nr:transglycosylase family protein [Rhodococcus sp. D2-41]MDG3010539.1 transglycosylase family protein [Rhodococcus sp. D2-41]
MTPNRVFKATKAKKTLGLVAATGALALIPMGLMTGTASAHDWDAVAQCESSGNWSIDSGNGYSGGLQFSPSTWAAYGGSGSPANASKSEQIAVAENVLAAQGPGAWPVCGAYL